MFDVQVKKKKQKTNNKNKCITQSSSTSGIYLHLLNSCKFITKPSGKSVENKMQKNIFCFLFLSLFLIKRGVFSMYLQNEKCTKMNEK